jgi:hypothetical protein
MASSLQLNGLMSPLPCTQSVEKTSDTISFLCNNYLSWILSFSGYTQLIWTSKVSRSICS